MNFIPEKLRSESILDFLKNQTVISMKETQFKSVARSKLNLDEKNTKESFLILIPQLFMVSWPYQSWYPTLKM